MLHVVAEYAGERLGARSDVDDVRSAHAAYFMTLARAARNGLRGSEQRGWKEVLGFEAENIRLALTYLAQSDRLDDATELAWSNLDPLADRPHARGAKDGAAELLRAEKLADASQARLRTVDGVLAALLADVDTAHAELAEVLEYLQGNDDLEAKAAALFGLGLAIAPSDPNRARELLVESAALFAANEDTWFEALVLAAVGWLDAGRGDFAPGRVRQSVCPRRGHRR